MMWIFKTKTSAGFLKKHISEFLWPAETLIKEHTVKNINGVTPHQSVDTKTFNKADIETGSSFGGLIAAVKLLC